MATDLAARPETRAAAPGGHRSLRAVLLAFVPVLIAFYTLQLRPVGPTGVVADLDIQLTLARLTLDGAIPLIDFEHGWNTASWYLSAALYELTGGNATAWAFLWGRVTGFMLAGFVVLGLAWRLRLPALWAGALVPAWLLLTHIPNTKYAVPILWALVILPVGRMASPGVAQALRVGMVATVWWFHVELAILLGIGTMLFDLVGQRDLGVPDRLRLIAATAVGGLVGVGSQVAVYAVLGLGPTALLTQLLFGQAETTAANYGYPLSAPGSIRQLLWPASLLVPFVPAIWRRLSDPTRLLALLHLAVALIGIRRTDFNHTAAAATLLAPLLVLGLRDLAAGGWAGWRTAGTAASGIRRALGIGGGVLWAAAGIAVAFRVESRLAIVGLTLVCLTAVAASHRWPLPWASAGAVLGLAALMTAGLSGFAVQQVRADQGGEAGAALADALRNEAGACLAGVSTAWVVPGPGSLYTDLGVTNPTPFYVFHYTLEAETERVLAALPDVPVVIQVGGWPSSMAGIAPTIESDYSSCAAVSVPAAGTDVTVWTR